VLLDGHGWGVITQKAGGDGDETGINTWVVISGLTLTAENVPFTTG